MALSQSPGTLDGPDSFQSTPFPDDTLVIRPILGIMLIPRFQESEQARGALQAARESKAEGWGWNRGSRSLRHPAEQKQNEQTSSKPCPFAHLWKCARAALPPLTQCLQLEPSKKRPVTMTPAFWPKSWWRTALPDLSAFLGSSRLWLYLLLSVVRARFSSLTGYPACFLSCLPDQGQSHLGPPGVVNTAAPPPRPLGSGLGREPLQVTP